MTLHSKSGRGVAYWSSKVEKYSTSISFISYWYMARLKKEGWTKATTWRYTVKKGRKEDSTKHARGHLSLCNFTTLALTYCIRIRKREIMKTR